MTEEMEEKENGTGTNGSRGNGGSDSPNGGDHRNGNDSNERNTSRGTESESGEAGDRDPNPPTGSGESESGGTLDEREDKRPSSGNVSELDEHGGESPADRKRRLDRERKRAKRERERAERGNPSSTRTSGTTGRTRTSEHEEKTLVVIEEVEIPLPKPKEQGTPQPSKPKVVSAGSKSAKAKAGDIAPDEMTLFIEGIFSLLGGVLNSPHWFISTDEAKQISVPLVKILNKQNKKRKDKVNDLMLPMLLVTAIGSIVVPRILLQMEEWKVKRSARKQLEARRKGQAQSFTNGANQREVASSGGGMESQTSRPYSETENGHDVYNANEFLPTVPPSLANWTDGSN